MKFPFCGSVFRVVVHRKGRMTRNAKKVIVPIVFGRVIGTPRWRRARVLKFLGIVRRRQLFVVFLRMLDIMVLPGRCRGSRVPFMVRLL